MPTTRDRNEIKRVRDLVQAKLKARRQTLGFELKVVDQVDEADGWITFVVIPARKRARAYDYAKALADVEVELRKEGIEEVLLVPAIPD